MDQKQAQLHQQVQTLIESAQGKSIDAFEIDASLERGFSVTARQGELENLEHHQETGITITVYKESRSGTASTSDDSTQALSAALDKACSIVQYAEPDPFSGLAEANLMAMEYPDLALHHPWDITPEAAIALCIECDESARSYDERVSQTEEASLTTTNHHRWYANSHGFFGDYSSSLHGLSISLVAKSTNGEMERDYDYSYSRNANALKSPAEIAQAAVNRVVQRLDAQKLSTRRCPVLFDTRVAKSLIRHLCGAISGSSLYRKTSFLLDHLNKKIFPDFVNIYQRPHIQSGYGSVPFDDQGVRTIDQSYVSDGVLTNYLLGSYSAKKLGMMTTGNAGGVFNLFVETGDKDLTDLLKEMGTGLLVTELMGQGVQLMTGDYSRGATGFWVENGEIQYPVHEVTVAANLKDMFAQIVAIGCDIDHESNVRTGSILIEDMMVAGS